MAADLMTALGPAAQLAGAAAVSLQLAALGLLAVLGFHRFGLAVRVLRGGPPGAGGADDPESWPVVTVQCPTYDEPHVAVRLLDAVCALDYPRDRLEIQVLDDSEDATTGLLRDRAAVHAARGVEVTVLHRDDRAGFKAGALQAGLERARGELLAVFDADFVPAPDFLRRTVPELGDPRVGLVQARWGHLNRDRSWLTRVQALLLDGHFLVEHAGRARAGRFFNFNGTAGVFRRDCIREAGGWQHDTLTEDLDLSYRAQLAGWRFVFLEDVVAPAELPADLRSWKSQQRRWTRGSVQTARKLLPRLLRADLPGAVKREALLHLTGNAAYPLLLALALTTFPAALARRALGWSALASVELPLLVGTTGVVCAFYLAAGARAGRPALRTFGLLPTLIAAGVGSSINSTRAVAAGLFREVGVFARTPKTGDAGGRPARAREALHRDPWALAELGLGALLLAQAAWCAVAGLWPTVPFLALFGSGFAAIGWGSWTSAGDARIPPQT